MKKSDLNILKNELNSIKNERIQIENIEKYTGDDQIPKGLKVKNLDCSIMFVDMRHSTDMTDENGRYNMVKIYKMFTKVVVKAVEENGGTVAQIMGDGMLCIFTKGKINSGQMAFDAAVSINTYLKIVYNPMVDDNWEISCGCGIRTGHVYITRVGLRGKNECSKVIYPSSITNYACKLCDMADCSEIIIDNTTYTQLSEEDKKKTDIVEINNLGKCRLAKDVTWGIEK